MLAQELDPGHSSTNGPLVLEEAASASSSSTSSAPLSRTDLTDDLLLSIFQLLASDFGPQAQASWPQAAGRHFAWFRRVMPLVCKRWNALLGGGGKFPWTSLVVSVESELPRRRKPEPGSSTAGAGGCLTAAVSPCGLSGGTAAAASVPGSSPPSNAPPGAPLSLFARTSSSVLPKLRSRSVVAWAEGRAAAVQHLLLDLASANHDLDGSRALEALLRAVNRGARGLRTLHLIWPDGAGGQDSYEMLGRLRGLGELHVDGLQQGFLAGTLPYLSGLSELTRLSFTPKTFQFPVSVPALPLNLRVLHLSNLWVGRLPPLASSAPHLEQLELVQCHLVAEVLGALAGAPGLRLLRLDGSRLTDAREAATSWESVRRWPACPALRRLHLGDCGLRALPGGLVGAFPGLELLDLSGNQGMGGVVGFPDAAAATSCLPAELCGLSGLEEVRLAKCGLTAVPAALLAVPSLTSLDLSHNSLSALPLAPGVPSPSPSPLPASSPHRGSPLLAHGAGGQGVWPPALPGSSRSSPPVLPSSPNGVGAAGRASAAATASTATASGVGYAAFAERLEVLNIGMNRFTSWPQGLLACTRLREVVLGELLVARAQEGDLQRLVGALPRLERLGVAGDSFEPRAVRHLLALQRHAAALGRPQLEIGGGV